MSLSDHQDTIRKLYLDENMKLEKLMQYMETRFGIRASQNAYQYQFKKWGFRKNKTRDVWIWADHQKETRKASAGQKEIEIHFNGTVISDTQVRKEIARNVTTMDRIRARAASPATPQGYSASTPNGSISNQPHVPDAVTTAESDLNAVQNNDSDRKILAEIMRDSISEDSEIRANLCKHYDRAFLGGIADTMVDGKSIYENIVKDIANEISRGTGNEAYNTYIGDGVLSATVSILKAAYNDDLASLRTALDWGKQTAPNAFDEIVFIARFVAARFGRMNIAKILFTIRDHCVQRDNEENTCLHLAALFNHPEMVKFLITRQSDIESRNKDGHTPWTQIGSSEEHERVSQLLIEAGTDVNCKVDGTHLLHDFAGRGEANKVLLLLQRGVNPCLRVQGSTALQFAVQNGDLETIRILEEATKNCNNVSHEKKDQAAKSRSRPDITDYFPPGTSTIPILRDHHHPRRSE